MLNHQQQNIFTRLTSLCRKVVENEVRTLYPNPGYPKLRKDLLITMSQEFDTIKSLPFCCTEQEKLTTVIKTLSDWSINQRRGP